MNALQDLQKRKLGILLSARPDQPGFRHALKLAEIALSRGVDVYLYCLDDAVYGIKIRQLQQLRSAGLKLYACAYGAERRNLAPDDDAIYSGLAVLNDLMAATERFVSFNS